MGSTGEIMWGIALKTGRSFDFFPELTESRGDKNLLDNTESPDMSTKVAVVKQLRGISLAGKSDSNHWVMMDGRKETGGEDAAPSPKELLLIALGGCTSMDVLPILKKKRVHIDGFEVRLTASTRDEHPQVFTDIHIEYVFFGDNIPKADVERAIELSTTKYCSISAMLQGSVKLSHAYTIAPAADMTAPGRPPDIPAENLNGSSSL